MSSEKDSSVFERIAELEAFASHLQNVSEAEKSHLARELHDELGAILTASKMDIAWVSGKLDKAQAPLVEKLARAIKNLEQGIQTKRRIIEDLRPTTLVTFGLATALRECAEQLREQTGWQLELELPDEEPDLAEPDAIALFRIAQESLTNIAKHARATKVRISFSCGGGAATLEIEDNGAGYRQPDRLPGSRGMLGMYLRVNARGGKLQLRSEPGAGTLVRAILPAHEETPADSTVMRPTA